jgi:hypothetical protein
LVEPLFFGLGEEGGLASLDVPLITNGKGAMNGARNIWLGSDYLEPKLLSSFEKLSVSGDKDKVLGIT